MPDSADRIGAPPALDRRRFLLAGVGAAGAFSCGTVLGAPRQAFAETTTDDVPPLSFAFVSDTHANTLEATRLGFLRLAFASIAAADPTFVLHAGDITDYGADDEYAAYLSTIPDTLRQRIHHVPGNHEARWDVHGLELYHQLFGPTPYSFDVAGLHVVGLDPTQLLQEPGHFGTDRLHWLAADLRRAGPSVLFQHYPFGAEHYYVNDQDAFFDAVAGLPVRAVFAGHIHREQVVRTNGFTQVAAKATKDAALYYWVERGADAGHVVLRVWAVSVAADGTDTRRELVTIPLEAGSEPSLRPRRIDLGTPAGGTVQVHVQIDEADAARVVRAQIYPQEVFGGSSTGTWADLARSGAEWVGAVSVAGLAAGTHRIQVRVDGESGAAYDATGPVTVAASGTAPVDRWQARLPGSIQGALAERDGIVVAASTTGHVEAFRPRPNGRTVAWQARVGPVHRGPAFSADGSTIFVPSADHRLHALNTANGKASWHFATSDPVLSSPVAATIDGEPSVLFAAGTRLYALDAANGELRWNSELHGFFAGRMACDGERVYAGSGDGTVRAVDAATGAPLWSVSVTTRTDPYGRLLYGPWDDTIELLPDGQILVSTVSNATSLDRETGAARWVVPGSHMYTPSLLVGTSLLLVDERGRTQLVDTGSGAAAWVTELGVRAFNAGPVRSDGVAWILGATGLLAGVELASGEILHRRQLGPANSFSTPVVVDGLLLTADQDGVIRGMALPD